jgi:hypothetical protein
MTTAANSANVLFISLLIFVFSLFLFGNRCSLRLGFRRLRSLAVLGLETLVAHALHALLVATAHFLYALPALRLPLRTGEVRLVAFLAGDSLPHGARFHASNPGLDARNLGFQLIDLAAKSSDVFGCGVTTM